VNAGASQGNDKPPTDDSGRIPIIVNQMVDQYSANDYSIKKQLVSEVLDLLIEIPSIDVREELVNFLYENITKGQYRPLLLYIDRNLVFLVPTIWKTLKVSKQHVYTMISELKRLNLIKRTDYKVEPPIPGIKGTRPRIHIVNGVKLSGAMDPRIAEAKAKYHRIFETYSNLGENRALEQTQLVNLVNQMVDQYISEGRFGTFAPDVNFLKERINEDSRTRQMDSRSTYQLAIRIQSKLSIYKPGGKQDV